MIRIPKVVLEGIKIPRIIFSISPSANLKTQEIFFLMKKIYEMGIWCFDIPSTNHLESFKRLRELIGDESLIGIFHIESATGISFTGKPLYQFESKIISTIIKNIIPQNLVKKIYPNHHIQDIFTQKEIDRIIFDDTVFEQFLLNINKKEFPLILIGEKYNDWLVGLGRVDLLSKMISVARKKGFIPILSAKWPTFVLPKVKSLDVSAYAIPINKKEGLFDHSQACNIIKKFEKPVISLNPLANGKLLKSPQKAFSFLFNELKIYGAITEISSEEEALTIFGVFKKIPSLIPFQKTK
jgi:hypothetical protein